jgi:hypothetical protein
MNNTYLVILKNPSGNPQETEERYITADSQKDAELEAMDIVAHHPFDDVTLVSVDLVEPRDLYHDEAASET